jgi:hypothetical protein
MVVEVVADMPALKEVYHQVQQLELVLGHTEIVGLELIKMAVTASLS